MIAARLFLIALRNMRRQFWRTALISLMFAVAVFLSTILVAVPISMDRIAEDAAKGLRLITIAHNSYGLPARYCNQIRAMQHVVACAPEIEFNATYRDPRDHIMALGVTDDIFTVSGSNEYQVPPDIRKKLEADRRGASVGSVLMREYGWKLGQQITLRDADSKVTLTLIPMLELPTLLTARSLFFDRRLFDDAVKGTYGSNTQDFASFLAVKVDRRENMDQAIGEIDENFHNSEAETETTDESDALNSVITNVGDVRAIAFSLCGVVLVTVFLIAANSMAMMVRDRVTEVAVLRSMGFGRGHAVALLLIEASLIGMIGGLFGAGVAMSLFNRGISLGALTGDLGYMAVAPDTAFGAIVLAMCVSLLSAIIPVMRAVRIPPAIALRKVV